ncbi:MAG: hypothetical protein Greene041619_631 [Candidatus Peregrinibacteria bacterium Greene0416_19]|nr:MAG: hypothetical protein Greene041619_631 [Candidatus Peregrinibacteria bacterium Greene0416_19]
MKKVIVIVLVVGLVSVGLVFGRGLFKSTTPFHTRNNETLIFSSDEAVIATAVRNDGIYLWDAKENTLLKRLQGSDMARPLAFHPNGSLLAVQQDMFARWYADGRKAQMWHNARKRSSMISAAYCQDGSLLAILNGSARENTLEVVSQYDSEILLTIHGVTHYTWCQQDLIAVAVGDSVQLWDANAGVKIKDYPRQSGKIAGLCFFDGFRQEVVSYSDTGDIYLWGTSPDDRRRERKGLPHANIGSIAYGTLRTWGDTPQYLAAATNDAVKIWRFYGGELQELPVVVDKLWSKHQFYSRLSPKAGYTTVYRYSEGNGHTLHLLKVAYTVPKS